MDNGNRQLVLIKISKFPDGKLKSKLQWPNSGTPLNDHLRRTTIHYKTAKKTQFRIETTCN